MPLNHIHFKIQAGNIWQKGYEPGTSTLFSATLDRGSLINFGII